MNFEFTSFVRALARDQSLPLPVRIFRLVCLATGGLCLLVILPANWAQNLPIWVNIGDVVLGAFGLWCLRESLRGRHRFVLFFVVAVLLLDAVWFLNAGSDGSVTYYFFAVALFPVAIFRGTARWTLTSLLALNVCALLLLDFFVPSLTTPFARPADRIIDLVSGVVCAGLAVVLIVWLIVQTHDQEHARLAQLARELTASEQRLRLALEASRQGWFDCDLAMREGIVSGEFARLIGRPPENWRVTGQEWRSRIHPQDLAATMQTFERCAASGEILCAEYRLRTESGEWMWVRSLGQAVDSTEPGQPRHMIGTLADVTKTKELEARLIQSQRLETVGTLAGGIAHDLNNILTPMLLASEVLREKVPGQADREMMASLATGARRGCAIVSQLMVFSRRMGQPRVRVDMLSLLREAVVALRAELPPGIDLVECLPANLRAVNADAVQLKQAVANLCANAREAMGWGGTLTISAENITVEAGVDSRDPMGRSGSHVAIAITDTGGGIEPGIVERIFDPFFTTKEIGRGSGLGLSIVYGIVKGHGGALTVASEPGNGTTFRVLLPAADA